MDFFAHLSFSFHFAWCVACWHNAFCPHGMFVCVCPTLPKHGFGSYLAALQRHRGQGAVQLGMLRVLRFLQQEILRHVTLSLPLLVKVILWYQQDENSVRQRLSGLRVPGAGPTFVWGVAPLQGGGTSTRRWSKFCTSASLPFFLNLQKCTLCGRTQVSEKPKLRALEMWVGAVLMVLRTGAENFPEW